jgi:hypothetical protein
VKFFLTVYITHVSAQLRGFAAAKDQCQRRAKSLKRKPVIEVRPVEREGKPSKGGVEEEEDHEVEMLRLRVAELEKDNQELKK